MNFMRGKRKNRRKWIFILWIVCLCSFLSFYVLQSFVAHRKGYFTPNYPKLTLTAHDDYETFFLQTGLGREAVDKLLANGDLETIRLVQDAFFSKDTVTCRALLGWLVKSDRVEKKDSAPLVDLKPGDILISFSTHSLGWNHGHAGLVISETQVLECTSLGKDSTIKSAEHWRTYSNYIVLRTKGVSDELRDEVAEYAVQNLCGVPYRLTAGLIGKKALEPNDSRFGLQCAYLVWYAWNHFGYDLDSDGGRLVTMNDLLHAPQLEVVQIYGMNPLEIG